MKKNRTKIVKIKMLKTKNIGVVIGYIDEVYEVTNDIYEILKKSDSAELYIEEEKEMVKVKSKNVK